MYTKKRTRKTSMNTASGQSKKVDYTFNIYVTVEFVFMPTSVTSSLLSQLTTEPKIRIPLAFVRDCIQTRLNYTCESNSIKNATEILAVLTDP